jgi:hypothetical protein
VNPQNTPSEEVLKGIFCFWKFYENHLKNPCKKNKKLGKRICKLNSLKDSSLPIFKRGDQSSKRINKESFLRNWASQNPVLLILNSLKKL